MKPRGLASAIPCEYCGERLFPHSMSFHQAKCAQKQARVMVPCPVCDKLFARPDLDSHLLRHQQNTTRSSSSSLQRQSARGANFGNVNNNISGNLGNNYAAQQQVGGGGGGGFGGPGSHGGLLPCAVCSRNFAPDRLAKHQAICRKAASRPRKVFNSTLHRVKGTEMESFVRTSGRAAGRPAAAAAAAAASSSSSSARPGKPQSGGWRQKHEEFIRNIRAAKRAKLYVERGGDLRDLPPPPPDENPHYIPCPHCGRRFAPEAGQRHIPRCATTIARPAPPPSIRHPSSSSSSHTSTRPMTAAPPPPPSSSTSSFSPRNVSFNSRPHFEGERGFTPAPGARPPALKKRAGTAGASRLRSTLPGPPQPSQQHLGGGSSPSRFPVVNPSHGTSARPSTATMPSSARPSARSSFETSSSAYGAFLGVRSTSGVEASYEQRQAERRAAAEQLKAERKRGMMF